MLLRLQYMLLGVGILAAATLFVAEYVAWHNLAVRESTKIVKKANVMMDQVTAVIKLAGNMLAHTKVIHPQDLRLNDLNSLLQKKEIYWGIEGVFIALDNAEQSVFSQFGEMKLAEPGFANLIGQLRHTANQYVLLQLSAEYLLIGAPLYSQRKEKAFIIIKINLRRLAEDFVRGGNFQGQVIIPEELPKYSQLQVLPESLHQHLLLPLQYKPHSFFSFIGQRATGLGVEIISIFATLIAIVLMLHNFFKKLYAAKPKAFVLEEHLEGIKVSCAKQRKFYDDLICMLNIPIFEAANQLTSAKHEEDKISLKTILLDAQDIIFPLTIKYDLKSTLHIKSDGEVTRYTGMIAKLIIVNLLYRALINTPKNGQVYIELSQRKRGLQVIVSDNGYALQPQQRRMDEFKLFCLPTSSLQVLVNMIDASIEYQANKDRGTNVVLTLSTTKHTSSADICNKDKTNVVLFPV